MGVWPVRGPVCPPLLTTWSRYSQGHDLITAGINPISSSFFTVPGGIYIPLYVPERITVVKLFMHNGSVCLGNIDMGLYSESGAAIVTNGSTAHTGNSQLQEFSISPTTVDAGLYFLAVAASNASTNLFASISVTATAKQWIKLLGCMYDSTFPLPAQATWTVVPTTEAGMPFIGLSTRSLVV